MAYITRDTQGNIIGRFALPQFEGQEWVDDASFLLVDAKKQKLDALNNECSAAIYAGFSSNALGTPYSYPAKDKDQTNLAACVLASLMPGIAADWTTEFWCADSNGIWSRRIHTAAQIQHVGTDGKAAIVAALDHLAALSAQVMGASTADALTTIVW